MKALAAFFVLLIVAACQAPPQGMTEAEIAQYEAEVRQELINRMDAYQEAVMRGDVETVDSYWTSDGRILAPGMDLAGGDLHAFIAGVFPTLTVTEVGDELLELLVHGDAAYGIYRYWETVQAEGEEPETMNAHCMIRWEKEDGEWRFDRDVCGPGEPKPGSFCILGCCVCFSRR